MKNLLYLFLFIALLSCKKSEDIPESIVIKDPIFEKMLVAQGIDSDKEVNGKIAKLDVMKVDTLLIQGDVSNINNTISNLAGIEAFENLSYLDCSYNTLSVLDLSKNAKLTYLKCSGIQELIAGVTDYKQVQSRILNPFANLQTIHCAYTNISTLDFVIKPQQLKVLNCTGSSLSSLNVSQLTNLEELYASWILYNRLDSIDLRQNTKLQKCKLQIYGLKSICVASIDKIPASGWEKMPTTNYENCQ